MPTRVWKSGEFWFARWGSKGKVYKSKDRARAKAKADKQGAAIQARRGGK